MARAQSTAGTAIRICPTTFRACNYNTQYLPRILDRIQKSAPKGQI